MADTVMTVRLPEAIAHDLDRLAKRERRSPDQFVLALARSAIRDWAWHRLMGITAERAARQPPVLVEIEDVQRIIADLVEDPDLRGELHDRWLFASSDVRRRTPRDELAFREAAGALATDAEYWDDFLRKNRESRDIISDRVVELER